MLSWPIPLTLFLITATIPGVVSQCSAVLSMVVSPHICIHAIGHSVYWPNDNGWTTRSGSLDAVVGIEHSLRKYMHRITHTTRTIVSKRKSVQSGTEHSIL